MNNRCFAAAFLAGLLSLPAEAAADGPPYPPPRSLGDSSRFGQRIQRTMRLLAASTPEHRHTVRILFYGQSITEQDWWVAVADDLRRRFPHANLIIENRAIGGFASNLLVKTAETDLYPFQPDLVVFHVYGSHVEYENIIRRIRERTTAEILLQNDHLAASDAIDEPTDPQSLSPAQWNPWMNHVFLPGIAEKYQAELVDQRAVWKQYLRDHHLSPRDLLRDDVHLNEHGCYLMAEAVKAHFQLRPDPKDAPAQGWVRDYLVGRDVELRDGALTLEFEGHRVDAVCAPGVAAAARVRIDGRPPSQFSELYALTRTTPYPGSKWPCLLKVGRQAPPVEEQWTLTLSEVADDLSTFRFRVAGETTGPDGEGSGAARFVSHSGGVVIEPEDWNFGYAQQVFQGAVEDGFEIRWQVRPLFVDELRPPRETPRGVEATVTLAQGLPPGRRRLEIDGEVARAVRALRVYRPPLHAAAAGRYNSGDVK